MLFEDDPYHDLCFEDCDRAPVVSGYAGDWVYQGSFSKSLAPGMRLGYMVASENLVQPLIRLKQAADLHSNRLAQAWVMHLLEAEHTAERVCRLQDHYRARRDHFGSVLDTHFGDLADWSSYGTVTPTPQPYSRQHWLRRWYSCPADRSTRMRIMQMPTERCA